jgi:hypothetical protein
VTGGKANRTGDTEALSSSDLARRKSWRESNGPRRESRAVDEPDAVSSEDDATLRPLARALLALAEQLLEEGGA